MSNLFIDIKLLLLSFLCIHQSVNSGIGTGRIEAAAAAAAAALAVALARAALLAMMMPLARVTMSLVTQSSAMPQ